MGVRKFLFAGLAGVAIVALAGMGYLAWRSGLTEHGTVVSATGSPVSRQLEVVHASCGQSPPIDIAETREQVTLTIDLDPAVRGECDAPVTTSMVTLDDPLGERTVVDGPTGAIVPVTRD